jgi:hypothetical protein
MLIIRMKNRGGEDKDVSLFSIFETARLRIGTTI